MIENLPIVGHERVCCYITRRFEILVFEYDQVYDDARIGTHIINGCKKEDETLEQSVVRKIFEESGLRLENPVFVGISEWESTLEQWKGQDLEQWKGQQQITDKALFLARGSIRYAGQLEPYRFRGRTKSGDDLSFSVYSY